METNTELKMIHLSEVESQQIKWLWYPFIPYGKLSIVQGDPGDGKSTLILNIAAKLSRGECIDENMNITEPVNVIYQTAEDGLADTVKPRLEAANADCSRISIIDESDKSVSMTDDRIEEAIKRENAKLCIFDPIQAYLGGDTDMNRANEAREMTKKLGSIAERTGCAIVLIGHMNKGSGAKAAYRGMGSIDFFAVARSVMLVGRIEGQSNLRAMIQIKNNLAAFGHPKAFELAEGGFHWLGDYEITADEVLGGMVPKASKLEVAKQFLRKQAERTQRILSTEIIELAAQEGISKRTLETAKKELKVKKYWEEHWENKEDMSEVFDYILDCLQKLLPEFKIANAVIHFDEASPHMHVVGVPVWKGAKRGLSKKVSKRNVFTPQTLSVILQDKLREEANYGFEYYFKEELAEKKKGRNYDLSVTEYKVAQESKKLADIKQQNNEEQEKNSKLRSNINAAETEYAKYEDMITDKKNNLERLSSKESELIERTKIAESVYDMFRQGGTDDVREKLIDVMYENQKLREENVTLKELLEKAYEFMKQFVIDGVNLLERFLESVGKVIGKVSKKTK